MKLRKIPTIFAGIAVLCLLVTFQVHADGLVLPGVTQLNDTTGTSSSPAVWYIDNDYACASGFQISASYNYLNLTNSYDFTTNGDMVVGTSGRHWTQLNIGSDSTVLVNGYLYCGQSTSIAQTSTYNNITVSGSGARLETTGNLLVGVGGGWLITNNSITVDDGGIVVVDSDKDGTGSFGLSYNWSYGNSWLELGDGLVALWGDQTSAYESGQGILSSIKVWDDITGQFQRIAYYQDSSTLVLTDYFDMFSANYITDAAMASSLGVSSEFVGFTVLQTTAVAEVPEPTTALLLALGVAAGLIRRKKS